MSTPRPEVAFLVAAIVLLALPLTATIGLLALGAVAVSDIRAGLDGPVSGQTATLFVVAAVAWVLLLVGAALALVRYVTRRAARS